jgi:hypothetical protein
MPRTKELKALLDGEYDHIGIHLFLYAGIVPRIGAIMTSTYIISESIT